MLTMMSYLQIRWKAHMSQRIIVQFRAPNCYFLFFGPLQSTSWDRPLRILSIYVSFNFMSTYGHFGPIFPYEFCYIVYPSSPLILYRYIMFQFTKKLGITWMKYKIQIDFVRMIRKVSLLLIFDISDIKLTKW